jgi:DNA polymerase
VRRAALVLKLPGAREIEMSREPDEELQLGSPAPEDEPGVELGRLAAAARSHLQWLADQGVAWIPGGAAPRQGTSPGAPLDLVIVEAPVESPQLRTFEAPLPVEAPSESEGPRAPEGLSGLPLGARGLEKVREALGDCHRCKLASGRIQLVFGDGNPEADLMFVGEAPGRDEDLAGEPFVGAAGALLSKMIAAMGLSRNDVFIANVIKCRPPRNRDPEPDEIERCIPFVLAQIEVIRPKIIVTLGRHAAQALLRTEAPVGRLRGRFHTMSAGGREIPVMPTYHPAYLLRNAEAKRPVWEDLKQVIARLRDLGVQGR